MERWSRQLRVVGFACLPVFVDPKTMQQPLSRNVRDYVLNKVRMLNKVNMVAMLGMTGC